MPKSTTKTRPAKAPAAKKPRPDFPLTPHPRGYWCKKVRGKLRYFGKIADDPEGEKALNLWLDQKDDLLAGRTIRVQPAGGLTVGDLVNHYLNAKKARVQSGELLQQTWDEYYKSCAADYPRVRVRPAGQRPCCRRLPAASGDDGQELGPGSPGE